MKAVVLEQIDSPLVVKDVELTPLSVGQVLVKVLVSGLCGSQLHEIRGHKGNAKFLPHLMGHEGCGVVEEVGPGVTTVNVGDKILISNVGAYCLTFSNRFPYKLPEIFLINRTNFKTIFDPNKTKDFSL